jgi:hypothetical protein
MTDAITTMTSEPENHVVDSATPRMSLHNEMKRSEASTATWTFLATAMFLHWRYSVFTWFSIPLVVAGMFAAAILIGSGFYLAKAGILRLVLRRPPSPVKDAAVLASSWLLFALSIATTIWLTRAAFLYVYGLRPAA